MTGEVDEEYWAKRRAARLEDRVAELEEMVMCLMLIAGAHEPQVKAWRQSKANWPDIGEDEERAGRRLIESLGIMTREKRSGLRS